MKYYMAVVYKSDMNGDLIPIKVLGIYKSMQECYTRVSRYNATNDDYSSVAIIRDTEL